MESKLPWAHWIRDFGHPVGFKTSLGVLITGDDGYIYIACTNNKAYAIEVDIKDGCKKDVISRIQAMKEFGSNHPLYGPWPDGIAFGPHRRLLGITTPNYARISPPPTLEPLEHMFSVSKKDESHAWVRTNLGLERFDDFIEDLDRVVWRTTSIQLEGIVPTSKIHENWGFRGSNIEFKAREVKLRNRGEADVARIGSIRTYESQMPKPFKQNMSGKPVPAFYPAIWIASPNIVFLPSVENIDYDHDSEVGRRRQAKITSQHALQNKGRNKSECSWEFDAWRDIFSKIRDDPLLAMDKHEAIFLEVKSLDTRASAGTDAALGEHTVRAHRIPDCTFGLSVSENSSPESLLGVECLRELFCHPECGLISDPKWLSFHLAFPWAVYEAKKTRSDPVFDQIRRSSEIYLNILHDLCLRPGHPESARAYQNGEKEQFQVFSMTSEGPYWRLFVCYRRLIPDVPLWLPDPTKIDRYDMKQIWEGDITYREMAWQLHCLVDQIHKWAVDVFRPFVLDRLRAWDAYLATFQNLTYSPDRTQTMQASFESNSASQTAKDFLRMRIEPALTQGTQEALDILDLQMSQQELGTGSMNSSAPSQDLPWWSKYAKPEVTRQRLLKGESPHPSIPQQSRRRRRRNRRGARMSDLNTRRESKRHRDAYKAHQSRENEEKVESPSLWFQ